MNTPQNVQIMLIRIKLSYTVEVRSFFSSTRIQQSETIGSIRKHILVRLVWTDKTLGRHIKNIITIREYHKYRKIKALIRKSIFKTSGKIRISIPDDCHIIRIINRCPLIIRLPRSIYILDITRFILSFYRSFLINNTIFQNIFITILHKIVGSINSIGLIPIHLT